MMKERRDEFTGGRCHRRWWRHIHLHSRSGSVVAVLRCLQQTLSVVVSRFVVSVSLVHGGCSWSWPIELVLLRLLRLLLLLGRTGGGETLVLHDGHLLVLFWGSMVQMLAHVSSWPPTGQGRQQPISVELGPGKPRPCHRLSPPFCCCATKEKHVNTNFMFQNDSFPRQTFDILRWSFGTVREYLGWGGERRALVILGIFSMMIRVRFFGTVV